MLPLIVHLENDAETRRRLKEALEGSFEVRQHESLESAEHEANVSLYVCGPLGKNSDGLIFALEQQRMGKRVLILADRRKFSRLPFLSTDALSDHRRVLASVRKAVQEE